MVGGGIVAVWEYQCKECGQLFDTSDEWVKGILDQMIEEQRLHHHGEGLGECQGLLRRKFSFSVRSTFQETFNQTTGTFTSSERQFKDQLKVQSEMDSMRHGYDINYQPVDLHDKEALGVTDEGLDETYRQRYDSGRADLIPSVDRPKVIHL